MIFNLHLVCILLILLSCGCLGYKHVIFMHGLLAGESEVQHFRAFVEKYHPGTGISVIDDFNYLNSLRPLWKQVDHIRQKMKDVMQKHPDGVHLVCFSQGGLICRGVVETLPTHNVVNFISLSSPQAGQFGDTNYLDPYLPQIVVKELYKILYTSKGQSMLSIANYWNDPYHQDLYQHWSNYLAALNNESSSSHRFTLAYKENFIRLKNLILVGGPDDGVITPWQSSQFGTFNHEGKVVECHYQKWYNEDWFGLKTLDMRHSLHLLTVRGVEHVKWHRNVSVFKNCIEPWLT